MREEVLKDRRKKKLRQDIERQTKESVQRSIEMIKEKEKLRQEILRQKEQFERKS